MTDKYTDEHQERYEDEGTEQRQRHPRMRRFFLFLGILAAVLGIVVVAAYRDGTGFDALRRYFSYGTAEKKSGTVGYTYDADANNRFALLGDNLVVLSGTELQILSKGGEKIYTAAISPMSSPALAVGGGRVVAYDVGGTELYVLDEDSELLHLTADEEEPYISATLNSSGWLAVTEEKSSCKASVSVYDAGMNLTFTFNSSERFVIDAAVTEDCKSLAAVTLGQKDSVFVSNVVLYHLSDTQPYANYDVSDGLVMSLGTVDGALAAVSDTCLTFSSSGQVRGTYSYGGEYLRESSVTGDGFAVLLLNRYRSGNAGKLVTVGADGSELASLDVKEEVRSVSAAGRYIAVLYADQLIIYNPDLQEYASLTGTDYARSVLMRTDGSALLLAADQAKLYLP